jgi:hypothetical protein
VPVGAERDRLLPVAREPDDLDAGVEFEQPLDPDADDLVIIGDEDADRPGTPAGRASPA